MGKRNDLSEFDKGQIVIARGLGQSISKTAALVGCSRSAVWTSEREDYGPEGIMFGLLRSLASPEIKLDILHTSNPRRLPDLQPQNKSIKPVCCLDPIFRYTKRHAKFKVPFEVDCGENVTN
ncbi:hypothetical protein DPX16_13101 [Anabarilius grahami]|uniref:Uncharacterized protein n=1 Tax=Anabarilius grahami TaxID=495550 RepID=A0A3N0YMF4_ANAGA|nr:hypothetical protein DPX16_13101 [Anabarilius grahami]